MNSLLITVILFSTSVFAGPRQHWQLNEEIRCELEFRKAGCKRAQNELQDQKFVSCVDKNIRDLTPLCQDMHKSNKEHKRI